MVSYHVDGYTIKPSVRKGKKYDVFKDGKHITSFGQAGAEHYHDVLGYYSSLDHWDKERRKRYRARHKHDNIHDKNSAGHYAYYFLW